MHALGKNQHPGINYVEDGTYRSPVINISETPTFLAVGICKLQTTGIGIIKI